MRDIPAELAQLREIANANLYARRTPRTESHARACLAYCNAIEQGAPLWKMYFAVLAAYDCSVD
jgi:hypothetical protein